MRMYYLMETESERAHTYARSVVSTTNYTAERNQTNTPLIIHQHCIGKQAEFAARNWFLRRGIPCSQVDDSVTRHKSFTADLFINGTTRVHVKSQDYRSAAQFETSWTFGYGGNNGTRGHRDNEIFDRYGIKDRVVFCLVEMDVWVSIAAVVPVHLLHELSLFRDPKKKSLIGIKKVVYLKDIPQEFLVK